MNHGVFATHYHHIEHLTMGEIFKPKKPTSSNELLQLVVEGKQEKVEKMILANMEDNPSLLLQFGTVTDLSGREFKHTSAFQYALWALDWHMWTVIKKYLSPEQQLEQYLAWEAREDKTLPPFPHQKHFSLQPLINALDKYIEMLKRNDVQADYHWQSTIGNEQKKLPVHVVNEYCREDRSFRPCPSFTEPQLPRSQVIGKDKVDWFTGEYKGREGLGKNCAVCRGRNDKAEQRPRSGDEVVKIDLNALKSLYHIRKQQRELLVGNLKTLSSKAVMKK